MLDPATLTAAGEFASGLAQNLIASIIVEGKKLKDERKASETADVHAAKMGGRTSTVILLQPSFRAQFVLAPIRRCVPAIYER
jgi:hypothetical protein